jgi:dTDP-glucose 4,6-dehydratase
MVGREGTGEHAARFPRFVTQYLLDAVAWAIALCAATLLRFELNVEFVPWKPIAYACLVASALQFIFGWIFHLYRGRHPIGSFDEVVSLLRVVVAVTLALSIPALILGGSIGLPRSVVFIAAPMAFVLTGGVRYVGRFVSERSNAPADGAELTLIYGAGHLGASIIRRMQTDDGASYIPVGIIDDDLRKRRAWVHGVKVMGTRTDIASVVRSTGATVLVITIAHADATLLREISDSAVGAGLLVKVLPPLEEVLAGKSRLRDLREISIEDLIGRHPVDTQMESIAGYLRGKRVLVTGAGGSIGSELCRQISKFQPRELIMLDRDETGLQGTQISIAGHGLLDTKDVVLADIRDAEALVAVFTERKPEVVFHAAALKHLPMLEQYPDEAWKTNVLGTLNVLEAARSAGVSTFVNISTDKAANPISVLGHSKRVAEKLTAWAAEESGRTYLSVRFGNVIGSRGSMLPTFTALIEAGGPLTITHPDVTRYFMTIPEACQLVVQAGGIGRPGEVLILDMGEPVRIMDVAERMIEMSGKDIAIIYTGLRPGEKLHEELIGIRESDERPIHPGISHTKIDSMSPAVLDKAGWKKRLARIPMDSTGPTKAQAKAQVVA